MAILCWAAKNSLRGTRTITGLKGRTRALETQKLSLAVWTLEYRMITGLKGRTADLKPRNYNWLAGL
jgi:hypothetical protein